MKYRQLTTLLLLLLILVAIAPITAQDTTCEEGFQLFQHALGESCVPETVERVVALEWSYIEMILTLGMQPVGVADIEGYHNWVKVPVTLDEDMVDVGSRQEPNLEQIISLDPDLILVPAFRAAENYEELNSIAPTLTFDHYPPDGASHYESMINAYITIADAVDRETEAEAVLAEVQAVYDMASEAVAEAGKGEDGFILSQAYLSGDSPTFRLFTDNAMAIEIIEQIGLENAWDDVPGDYGFSTVDFEAFDAIGDVNFFYIAQPEDNDVIVDAPVWDVLPFVQSEKDYWLGGDVWLFGGPLSAVTLIETVTDAMGIELDSAGTSSTEDYPMTIEHELGTTTIEATPERIVVLEYSFADHLGTLGIAPVGFAVDAPPEYIYAYTSDLGAVDVGTRTEPNLEAILQLDPDFIIADLTRHEAIYDQLSLIAPTVVFNSLRGSYDDQLDQFSVIAEALGKGEEAVDILASYQEQFDATLASTNADAGEFVIGVLWSGGFTAHSDESFMGSLLESLGRTNALEPEGAETQYLIDMEGFASVNPATIVILCDPVDQQYLDEMSASPLWQAFDAVVNNRVYTFDRNLWSKGRGITAYEQILADSVNSGLLADTESSGFACVG